jgi:enamine deaminase RidA (YjgF/YER057c/UK114 family)
MGFASTSAGLRFGGRGRSTHPTLLVVVSRLARPGWLIEIEAVAAID